MDSEPTAPLPPIKPRRPRIWGIIPRLSWDQVSGTLVGGGIMLILSLSALALVISLLNAQRTADSLRLLDQLQADHRAETRERNNRTLEVVERLETFIHDELAASIRREDRARRAQFERLLRDIRSLRFEVESSSGNTIIVRPRPTATATATRTVPPGRGRGGRGGGP